MRRGKVRLLGVLLILALSGLMTAHVPVAAADGKVNINDATTEELATLPGIGKTYADRIVAYRKKNGPFKRIEDLLNVRGIGDKTFEKIRHRLTVGKKK